MPRRTNSFVDLSGCDPSADDALLASLPDMIAAAEPLLSNPALLEERAEALATTYRRWRRRGRTAGTDARRADVCGALGFCLFTLRVLRSARSAPLSPSRWRRVSRELNLLFRPPEVKAVFSRLYDFPGGEYDLAGAVVHRIGTTSFLLKVLPAPGSAATTAALKCLLYPYTRMESLAGATRHYADDYGRDASRPCRQMVEVYRSTSKWVLMRFVDGPTLAEILRDEVHAADGPPSGLRADRLRRYGVALVRALAAVPFPHLDLSPSNVIVESQDPDVPAGPEARLVLIDFGQNYLLTQDVAGGLVLPETVRYIAPELLGSRAAHREPTGYEDVYSLGQTLLELAGYGESDGGYIPTSLFMEAPLVGRLIEDLLDQQPVNRLLLSLQPLGPSIVDERRAVYDELLKRLQDALAAHDSLARAAELSPAPADTNLLRRAWVALTRAADEPSRLRRLAEAFPAEAVVARVRDFPVAKFVKFLQVIRHADGLAAEFRPFFRWAVICSAGWAVVWFLVLGSIHEDTQKVSLLPNVADVLRPFFPFVDVAALARHYAPLPRAWPPGWADLPSRVATLTFGLTITRYYLEIFSMLGLRSLRQTVHVVAARVLMRMMALGGLATILAYQYVVARSFPSHGALYWGLAMQLVVANNLVSQRLARACVREGEREFSTIRRSDLGRSVDAFDEWWKLMFWYSVVLCGFDLVINAGLAKDVVLYALLVILVNVLVLYRGNCGKKAPGLRATLSRAYVTGERLEARRQRRPAWGRSMGARVQVPPPRPPSTNPQV
jgi:hypothetical protein